MKCFCCLCSQDGTEKQERSRTGDGRILRVVFFDPPSPGRILLRPPKPHRQLGDGYPDKSRVWGRVWLHALEIVLTQCSNLQRTPLLQTCAFV